MLKHHHFASAAETKKPSRCPVIAEKLVKLDQFGYAFNFKLPQGRDTYKTGLGAAISILLFMTSVFYGTLSMQRLVRFEETVPVTMSTSEGYFSNDFVFSSDDGL